MKWTKKTIIENINETGGLNWGHIRWCARQDGVSVWEEVRGYIKNSYDVHGNTANAVANYLCNPY